MKLPDFLCLDGQGLVRFNVHPVGFLDVVRAYNESYSGDMVYCRFPVLPPSLIHQALAYYLDNKPQVDIWLASEPSVRRQGHWIVLGNPGLVELRKRIEAMHQAEKAHCTH